MSINQRSHDNPWAVLAVMCLALFMVLLDTTIVNLTEQAEEAA